MTKEALLCITVASGLLAGASGQPGPPPPRQGDDGVGAALLCPGDCAIPHDNVVGVADFLALLDQWGVVGAPCDFDGGGVGVTDFLELLAMWGPCAMPANDECADAVKLDVPAGGSVDIDGTTIGATLDGVECVTPTTAPGVWYSVIGNGNTLTASTCNQADYDTKISVFCGACPAGSDCCIPNGTPGCDTPKCMDLVCAPDPFCCDVAWDGNCAAAALDLCKVCGASAFPCVDGADDTPGCGLTTQVTWCAKAGAIYHILVHGFGSATGNFTLTVSDDGAACTPLVDCPVICETDADCPDGFKCVDGDCIQVSTGACCQCDGPAQFCTIETEADCLALDGLYLGDGAVCENAACETAYPGQCSCDAPSVECWVEVFPSGTPLACEGDCCILMVGWDVTVPDGCDYTTEAIIDIGCEQIEITNGQLVYLDCGASSCNSYGFGGLVRIWADFADLTVTIEDSGGNVDSCFEALCQYCFEN